MLVQLTTEQLHELIRGAVADALDEHHPTQDEPLTVSGAEMAMRLGVSRSMVHNLRLEGCPCLRMGDHYRYEPEAVLSWLRSRSKN
jgi:hypothetical protein